MKKKISIIAVVLLWASIGCAALHPCLPRVAKEVFVPYDPNQIEGFLLDALSIPHDKIIQVDIWVCHNEEVPLRLFNLPDNATWNGDTLTWAPTEEQKGQTFYIVIKAGSGVYEDVITLPLYCWEPMTPMIVIDNKRRLP